MELVGVRSREDLFLMVHGVSEFIGFVEIGSKKCYRGVVGIIKCNLGDRRRQLVIMNFVTVRLLILFCLFQNLFYAF